MVVYTYNPSPQKAEASGPQSSRYAWSTQTVLAEIGLYRETLSEKTNKRTTDK